MSEEAETKVRVDERDDGTVVFEFTDKNFTVTMKSLSWGLIEDLNQIDAAESNGARAQAIVKFFNENVEGGAKAVPLRHTDAAMGTLKAYMDHISAAQKKTA